MPPPCAARTLTEAALPICLLGSRPTAGVDRSARVRRRPAAHRLLLSAAPVRAPCLTGQRIPVPFVDERVDTRKQHCKERSRDRSPQCEDEQAGAAS
jgi:hypothetical protein